MKSWRRSKREKEKRERGKKRTTKFYLSLFYLLPRPLSLRTYVSRFFRTEPPRARRNFFNARPIIKLSFVRYVCGVSGVCERSRDLLGCKWYENRARASPPRRQAVEKKRWNGDHRGRWLARDRDRERIRERKNIERDSRPSARERTRWKAVHESESNVRVSKGREPGGKERVRTGARKRCATAEPLTHSRPGK